MKTTRNTKNKILAMVAAPSAIPPNPNTAATIAMIKNIIVHLSIANVYWLGRFTDNNYTSGENPAQKHLMTFRI